jgi:hypothetical protein
MGGLLFCPVLPGHAGSSLVCVCVFVCVCKGDGVCGPQKGFYASGGHHQELNLAEMRPHAQRRLQRGCPGTGRGGARPQGASLPRLPSQPSRALLRALRAAARPQSNAVKHGQPTDNLQVLGAAYPWISRRLLTRPSPELRATLKRLLYKGGGFRCAPPTTPPPLAQQRRAAPRRALPKATTLRGARCDSAPSNKPAMWTLLARPGAAPRWPRVAS